MVFTEADVKKILAREKTQTRRPAKAGEILFLPSPSRSSSWVSGKNRRLKWKVGNTYAVQPGRGKKAVARVRVTDIRREALQDISKADCLAEGVVPPTSPCDTDTRMLALRNRFGRLWDAVNDKPGVRFFDNPDVWVLTFELVSNERA